ncbi:MAG: hypothetical protein IJJ56_05160 [Prevotella sp.]|nr:hypothetical protein [Prevotella sp.]
MRKIILILLCLLPIVSSAEEATSPNGLVKARFYIEDGMMTYEVTYKERPAMDVSKVNPQNHAYVNATFCNLGWLCHQHHTCSIV